MVIGRSSRTVVPIPTLLCQRNPAADLFDRGAHHIHSDAAAGNIRYFGCGRKSGRRKPDRRPARRSERPAHRAAIICFSEALRRTTAGSIPRPSSVTSTRSRSPIRDASIEIVAASGFPAARRCSGSFDTVIQGIAHQMHHGFEKTIHDGLVGFRGLAVRNQRDLLVELPRRHRAPAVEKTRTAAPPAPSATAGPCRAIRSPGGRWRHGRAGLTLRLRCPPRSCSTCLAECASAFFATTSSPAKLTRASIFASLTRSTRSAGRSVRWPRYWVGHVLGGRR